MPKGPQGQKRPADINQLAKRIVDIATGEVPDVPQKKERPAKGAPRRSKKVTPAARKP
jgi:hypothetical protein